jgi:hypothetical protein
VKIERDMGTPSYEGKQVYMGLDVHLEFLIASLSLWRNSQNPTSLRLRQGISAGGRAPLREEQL